MLGPAVDLRGHPVVTALAPLPVARPSWLDAVHVALVVFPLCRLIRFERGGGAAAVLLLHATAHGIAESTAGDDTDQSARRATGQTADDSAEASAYGRAGTRRRRAA